MNILLRRGDKGSDVLWLQQMLVQRGNYGIAVDGIFGPATEDAVRHFQKTNGLTVDGVAGPITMSKLDPDWAVLNNRQKSTPISPYTARVIAIAEGYEGVRETSENRGPHINQWLAELGINFAAPWCMAFVQGCFRQAALEMGIDDPLKPDTAGVLDLWNRVPKGWRVGPLNGRAGDIMILDFGGGKGHTGIVTGYKNGMYITVEGNTNDAGSRDGDCVAEKYRKKYNSPRLKGFVRVPAEAIA